MVSAIVGCRHRVGLVLILFNIINFEPMSCRHELSFNLGSNF